MWIYLRQLAVLFSASIVAATTVNSMSPRGIEWTDSWADLEALARDSGLRSVDAWEAWAITEEGTHVVLDARSVEEYEAGHIPGALSAPAHAATEAVRSVQGQLSRTQPIIVYCGSPDCDQSLILGRYLKSIGYENVSLFLGGMAAWTETELPVETGL
jgi:rhodanese-related sulfurtransferase